MKQVVVHVAVAVLLLRLGLCDAENVILGTTKQLLCQFRNGYTWQKFNDLTNLWEEIDNNKRYSGAYSSILTITNFQIEDSGNLRCMAVVNQLDVYGSSIILKPEIRAFIGSTVTLTCTVSGKSLNWFKTVSRSLLTLIDNAKYNGSQTNILKIKAVTSDDAAIFFCRVLNGPKGPDITVSIFASVDGGWSSWSSFEVCTGTCGTGQQRRRRYCNNPSPTNGGASCQGDENEYQSCTLAACPVDGRWSSWYSWEVCTITCGTGQQSRRRYCNNPVPANRGASCQGEIYDYNSCLFSACAEIDKQQSQTISITVGAVSGVLVILVVIAVVIILTKRKWYHPKKEPDYEKTDTMRGKSHIYGETNVNHIYMNNQQSAEIEVIASESTYIVEADLVERYDVSELNDRIRNKEFFLQNLIEEFKLLNNSTSDPEPFVNQYEIIDIGIRKDVNQFNLNSSTLKMLYHNNVSVLLEIPHKNLAEQFWTIVDDHSIENVILLIKENEKVTEFYPTLDDSFRMKNFEIYLNSAERTNTNIMLLSFNLQNKTTQKMRNVKIFKTNVCKSLSVEAMCCILGKASEVTDAPVLIINSKTTDLSVCGVLTVCLNVIYSIKDGSTFSVLENAMVANKNDRGFFKNFDDYDLCYKVMGNYLESVNTYDFIE